LPTRILVASLLAASGAFAAAIIAAALVFFAAGQVIRVRELKGVPRAKAEPWSFTLKFAFAHFNSEVS
jgi:hypothetical protein